MIYTNNFINRLFRSIPSKGCFRYSVLFQKLRKNIINTVKVDDSISRRVPRLFFGCSPSTVIFGVAFQRLVIRFFYKYVTYRAQLHSVMVKIKDATCEYESQTASLMQVSRTYLLTYNNI